MKKSRLISSLLLVMAAAIWGFAFVAQKDGGEYTGPYMFAFLRYFLGCMFLLPFVIFRRKQGLTVLSGKKTVLVGIIVGIVLFIATTLQQVALYLGASAGMSGFLTTFYIILVPLLSLFLGKKCGINIWIAVIIAIIGLYFLCIKEGDFSFNGYDIMLLLCALFFSIQIMMVDKYISSIDGTTISFMSFAVCTILSILPAFMIDLKGSFANVPTLIENMNHVPFIISILYTGILSSGVAYTLQIIGQRNVSPSVASLLMSLESVFSVFGGWLILGESFGKRQVIGYILMFTAIIVAQLNIGKNTNKSD